MFKKILIIFTFILFIPNIHAYEVHYGDAYDINSYDVNMVVNEDNSFEITEKIVANFNQPRHGIFRKIPVRNEVKRQDGSTSYNFATISNVKMNTEGTIEKGYSEFNIKLGDPDKYIEGTKNYEISYLYKLSNDNVKEFDELYFNIIGTEWDTSIDNITFTITMPKEFDKEKIGFTYGSYRSSNTDSITYEVNGNVITGKLNKKLGKYEGLTVRLELPEGYFIKDKMEFNGYICIFISILFLFIGYILWKKYGVDEKTVETVTFYPPDRLNSLDIGYIYKGNTDSTDVTSLLIYLANKGYLIIEEDKENESIFNKNAFKITRAKDYDGSDPLERRFIEDLFYCSKIYGASNKNAFVYKEDLVNNFYTTVNHIISEQNKKSRIKHFDKIADSKRIYVLLMAIIVLIIGISLPIYKMFPIEILFMNFLAYVMFVSLCLAMIKSFITSIKTKKIPNLILTLFIAFVFIPSIFSFILSIGIESRLYLGVNLLSTVVSTISFVGLCIIYYIIPKRTSYSTKILGRVLGFKNFLETAEKDKLELLVNRDPSYFYDILPYAYVLGVSDKWIGKFENILCSPPDWYTGSTFDSVAFGSFINGTMSAANSAMTSTPSSSSSGGSSGGGCSGGGSGGGGGGSW